MQGGIERAVLDLQNLIGGLLDDVRDRVAMRRACDQGPQNQEIERAAQHVASAATLRRVFDHAGTLPQDSLLE